jgi:hypothetical protein
MQAMPSATQTQHCIATLYEVGLFECTARDAVLSSTPRREVWLSLLICFTESNYTTDIGAVSFLTMLYIQLHGKNGVLHRDMIV